MHDFDFLKLRQPKTHWFFKALKTTIYSAQDFFFGGVERKFFVICKIQFLIDE